MKKSLAELLGWEGPGAVLTHRHFGAWQAWLQGEWNRPSRSDHYTAQVACEVRRVLAKKPAAIRLKDFLLQFKFKGAAKKPATKEQATAQAKTWLSMFLGRNIDDLPQKPRE